ncbi:hypothetical protein, conserved [Eimeria necatrix]|uniref:Uncharacterized protein n=1 Tax=Eimeria necatrix TaxID=51315 RepID=U6N6H2_9EIME|nr:hypothetical protein, conserved [Eimeria necatrix]CDJ69506.1 hypothetical protein, conserved [Eimeria necatrix]
MPFLPMDPAQTAGAAAAAAAAAAANSGNALQQKHAEYEQTALRLSLCSDESLVSVLKKLLPRVILELMTCPPASLPKASGHSVI